MSTYPQPSFVRGATLSRIRRSRAAGWESTCVNGNELCEGTTCQVNGSDARLNYTLKLDLKICLFCRATYSLTGNRPTPENNANEVRKIDN